MNSLLFERSLGTVGPQVLSRTQTTRLVYALQPTHVQFNSDEQTTLAHASGTTAIDIDRFEGRYLLSGGADASISIWDLDAAEQIANTVHAPIVSVGRDSQIHQRAITQLRFYPFDSLAFTSSSYDHTLKLCSSITLAPSASFDLGSPIYSHAVSPIADHLLVACATQLPTVRLVDLKSGASTHSLAGHTGAVFAVAWSPNREHILASGGIDGAVRFWDIRRSAAALSSLDMEDSIGVTKFNASSSNSGRPRKAHSNAVNGILWSDDGQHMVTAGHDERIRLWNMDTGANTLIQFGPTVKNKHLSTAITVLAPKNFTLPGRDVLFYPNERDITVYSLFEGTLLKRLKPIAEATDAPTMNPGTGSRFSKNRTTALAWRAHSVELYSAHSDGKICAWMPRTNEDAVADAEEAEEREGGVGGDRKRKRDVLDEVEDEVMGRNITFS